MNKIGNNNKINNSVIGDNNKVESKQSYLVEIIVAVLAGLIVAGLTYYFGWK